MQQAWTNPAAAAELAPAGRPWNGVHCWFEREGPRILVAVDLETHDWGSDKRYQGRACQFGMVVALETFPRERNPNLRILEKYEVLVKPDSWEISSKATNFHHIQQAECAKFGMPLAEVLKHFEARTRHYQKIASTWLCVHNKAHERSILASATALLSPLVVTRASDQRTNAS